MFNWTDITFLESSENLKPKIKALTGRTPSTAIAREVGTCLQQGRLFYQSAADSPLQIRPLLLFYGTMAFAKALNIAFNLTPTASLPHSHGIGDVSAQNSKISELTVKINTNGTFQPFNDITSKLNRVDYIDADTMNRHFMAPTEISANLANLQISLKEILSRIPGLEALYRKTFGELSNCVHINLKAELYNKKNWELLITPKEIFHDRASLRAIISELRNTFPVLKKLNLSSAAPAWNASYIDFSNLPIPDDEFAETHLQPREGGFSTKDARSNNESLPYESFQILVKDHAGTFCEPNYLISPFNNLYISKMSLHYLGMYLLSSLVRYRPEIWGYAITRSARPDGKSDDHMLSLIEEFMRRHVEEVPRFVAEIFERT